MFNQALAFLTQMTLPNLKLALPNFKLALPNFKLAWQFYQEEKHYSHQSFARWTQAILMVFIVTLSQTSDSIQGYLNQNLENLLLAYLNRFDIHL